MIAIKVDRHPLQCKFDQDKYQTNKGIRGFKKHTRTKEFDLRILKIEDLTIRLKEKDSNLKKMKQPIEKAKCIRKNKQENRKKTRYKKCV